jgi:hypothetical protein
MYLNKESIMLFLAEDVAKLKVKEAIEYGLESQRVNRELKGNSRTPYAKNIIKATASFTEELLNWISQLPCEFRKRFAFRQKIGFSECG